MNLKFFFNLTDINCAIYMAEEDFASQMCYPKGYSPCINNNPSIGDRAMTKIQFGCWLANSPTTIKKVSSHSVPSSKDLVSTRPRHPHPQIFLIEMSDGSVHRTHKRNLVFIKPTSNI